MSAFGPKRTSAVAPHMSAFGGKADMLPGISADQFVLKVRQEYIKTLKGLPGPKKN